MMMRSQRTGRTTLAELARALSAVQLVGDGTTLVSGVRQDSRRVEAGDLFAVRGGERTHGLHHVKDALSRGAVALLVEGELAQVPTSVPVIVVPDVRVAIARAAAAVYGDPMSSLEVVGITGTNGKTTTSYLAMQALQANSLRVGVMGTVGYRFEDQLIDAPHTTPEADEVMRVASWMKQRGASHLVMEVSSHALAQERVYGVPFRVAAFTNLTQDHLDFHGDMQAYGAAKAKLFFEFAPRDAVINVDDPFGDDLAARLDRSPVRVSRLTGTAVDIAPTRVELGPRRTKATLSTPTGLIELDSNLIGGHNLSNMVVALGIAHALGLDLARAADSLSNAAVPGRFERCDGAADDIVVVVDYAHTPDALDRVLSALTLLRQGSNALGRLICVFGCGGDRDPKKRAPMGEAVAKWADVAVVTSDNPRSEDPRAIVDAILPGLRDARAVVVELDRRRAIDDAIQGARPGDVVLIAGKGHESYQVALGQSSHFDDREEAKSALLRRRTLRGTS